MMVFEPEAPYGKKGKQPNIALKIFDMLESIYGKTPTTDEILYFNYAVLYSNHYRTKSAES